MNQSNNSNKKKYTFCLLPLPPIPPQRVLSMIPITKSYHFIIFCIEVVLIYCITHLVSIAGIAYFIFFAIFSQDMYYIYIQFISEARLIYTYNADGIYASSNASFSLLNYLFCSLIGSVTDVPSVGWSLGWLEGPFHPSVGLS